MSNGKVYLVGAGPGDEGLLTLRGSELIAKADVVIYDYLVNPAFLTRCRPDTEQVNVGKRAGYHSFKQEEINALLVDYARKGLQIVRLKGGDPYVFGRGGEEVQALQQEGLSYEVVPGVTAGVAVPAYAGIPVTHRDFCSSLTFVTGHKREEDGLSNINWNALASLGGTLVFYMGIKNIGDIARHLTTAGMSPKTPVAVIRYGTYPTQQKLIATLADIETRVREAGITPPAITVVGEVVSLHNELDWFARKPLLGKRVLVTRSRDQASCLVAELQARGAEVVELPTISLCPLANLSELSRQFEQLSQLDWLIFTSANAVTIFFSHLRKEGKDARTLGTCRVAAIGKETAASLIAVGIYPDFVPQRQTSEGFAVEFPQHYTVQRLKLLIPGSERSRPVLSEALRAQGAQVTVLPVYTNESVAYTTAQLSELFARPFDWVTFCSSSAAQNCCTLLRDHALPNALTHTRIASIGEVTAATLREYGYPVTVMPPKPAIAALAQAIEQYEQQQ